MKSKYRFEAVNSIAMVVIYEADRTRLTLED